MLKSKEQPPAKAARAEGAAPAGPPPPDARDLEIERLGRALAEEKAHGQTMREGSDALRFKLEILEKSYAKQLADTRLRADTATKELTALKAQVAEFGKGGEDTLRALSKMRADLLNITAERNQLRDQLAKGGAQSNRSQGGRSYVPRPVEDTSDTINALIKTTVLREGDDPGDGILNSRVKLEQGPSEIMISPDEIFTAKDKDKDDDEKSAA